LSFVDRHREVNAFPSAGKGPSKRKEQPGSDRKSVGREISHMEPDTRVARIGIESGSPPVEAPVDDRGLKDLDA
jgi:hypothetical protein